MISFVWAAGQRLPAGTGGSENYTIGHVRELTRRGIAAQVVTIGLGDADGREEFPGIRFHSLASVADVAGLDGTVVFVTMFPDVATASPAYQILHIPPPRREGERRLARAQTRDRGLIATSRFAARLWSQFLDVDPATVQVVYPFAEPCFSTQPRTVGSPMAIRILYAGRLSPEKGIYTLLEALHSEVIDDLNALGVDVTFTATTAGADKPQGEIIRGLVAAHPGIRLVDARRTPAGMAELMAEHDIVVMPSNSQYWHETFGIVSIEAQHTGCRVIASDDGGLPETDCGAVTLVVPDDADALAHGIRQAIAMGPVTEAGRAGATTRFTVTQSVDELLAVLARPRPRTPAEIVHELHTLIQRPAASLRSRPVRLAPATVPSLPKTLVASPHGEGVAHE